MEQSTLDYSRRLTYSELPITPSGARSGWHIFGEDDQVGLLNLQTPDRVISASGLVISGEVFSLNLDLSVIDPPLFGRGAPIHTVIDEGTGQSFDDKLDNYYPQLSSQWDSLGHVGYSTNSFYNGATSEQVARGERNTIGHWSRRGIVGRGVVLDIEAIFGTAGEGFVPGDDIRISVEDLEDARKLANIDWSPGDIALLHTGYLNWYKCQDFLVRSQLARTDQFLSIGLDRGPQMLAYLWDSGMSGIAADNPALEATPFDLDQRSWPYGFLHHCLIGQLGMAVGELWWLHDLAMSCRQDSRYEVFLTSAPIALSAGIGSPANALAIR